MKTFLTSLIPLIFIAPLTINSQITVVLQPGPVEGKDATIWTLEPTTNYGAYHDYIAATWTFDGDEGTYRSLLEFNMDTIPQGAEITCASLSLFYNDLSGTNGQEGENESVLQRITSSWVEDVVTWNTMPTTTAVHQVLLPESTFITEDYLDIDVSEMVADMIADPANSHGFMISLTTEETYSSMKYYSTDQVGDDTKFPRLEICYNAPDAIDEFKNKNLTISPNPVSDHATINFQKPVEVESFCTLTNMNGEIVFRQIVGKGTTEITIQIPESLPNGIYALSVSDKQQINSYKLVKN